MMENQWVPNNNFDDEILAIQPECDVTFAHYPPTENQMATEMLKEHQYEIPDRNRDAQLVQKIKEAWPSGVPIGKLETPEDIEEANTHGYEIMSMIRRAGMGPSVEECLTSKRTIPAITSNNSYVKGSWPILLDEDHFRLKPRKSISSIASSSNSSNNSSTTSVLNTSASDDDRIKPADRLSSQITSSTTATINSSKSQHPRRKIGAEFSKKSTDNNIILNDDEIASTRKKLVFLTPHELYRRKRPQYNSAKKGQSKFFYQKNI